MPLPACACADCATQQSCRFRAKVPAETTHQDSLCPLQVLQAMLTPCPRAQPIPTACAGHAVRRRRQQRGRAAGPAAHHRGQRGQHQARQHQHGPHPVHLQRRLPQLQAQRHAGRAAGAAAHPRGAARPHVRPSPPGPGAQGWGPTGAVRLAGAAAGTWSAAHASCGPVAGAADGASGAAAPGQPALQFHAQGHLDEDGCSRWGAPAGRRTFTGS